MNTQTVSCAYCGKDVEKPVGEVTRALKKGRQMFCDLSCTAKHANQKRKRKEVVLDCPGCGKSFKTTTHNKAKRHCSPSCASHASMSPERRAAQSQGGHLAKHHLISVDAVLKSREK